MRFITIFFCLFSLCAICSEKTDYEKFKIGTFIEVPSHSTLISVGKGRESLSLKKQRIQYFPSATSNWGFTLEYKLLDFKYKTLIFDEKSFVANKYGKSNHNEYIFKYKFHPFTLKFFYLETKGFYADLNSLSGSTYSNTKSTNVSPTTRVEDIWMRPDIFAKSWGINFAIKTPNIIISEKENQLQLHLIAALDYLNYSFEGDYSLIHPTKQSSFGNELTSLSGIQFQRLGLDLGGSLTYRFSDQFSIFLLGKGGPGFQRSVELTPESKEYAYNSSMHLNIETGLRYKVYEHELKTTFGLDSWSSRLKNGYLDTQKTAFLIAFKMTF